MNINRKKLLAAYQQLKAQKVLYGFGAKLEGGSDPRSGHRWNRRSTGKLNTPLSTIENIDCSGFIVKMFYEAAGGRFVDGSQSQRDWCEKNLKEVPYSDCAKKDNVLRIAFMTPRVHGVGSIGHVWLCFNGNTMESYGGHGVGSHAWDRYSNHVSKCFEVPSFSGVEGNLPLVATTRAPVPESKAPTTAPSIIVTHWENGKAVNKRMASVLDKDKNWVPAQEFLQAAGIAFSVSEWSDGTPNIRISAASGE